ncbi:MAG: preprotein translocase subunit YajC [Pseudomonadales bacterium]|nr:preprotein translocase subunit YajC [Pseudomonadales bacterium]
MEFFISAAHAQEAAQQPSVAFNLLFIGGMFVLFYLILWRPQAKRAKEHKELVNALAKGDEVLTSGGILGKVTQVSEDYVTIEVAENVELNMQKSAVAAALPKGTIKSI